MKRLEFRVVNPNTAAEGEPFVVIGSKMKTGKWQLRPAFPVFVDSETGQETLAPIWYEETAK